MCIRVDRTVHITAELVRQYAYLSGDENPIHLTPQVAVESQFKRPIAHGMLVMGLGAQLMLAFAEKSYSITEYEMKFLSPVYVNDSIRLIAEKRNDSNWVNIRGYVQGEIFVKGKGRYVENRLP